MEGASALRKRVGVLTPAYWPSTHLKDPAAAAAFIRDHYHEPVQWLEAREAKKRIEDYQALNGVPTRVLINDVEVTGQLVQRPDRGVTVDAQSSTVRVYVNDVGGVHIPSLPGGGT